MTGGLQWRKSTFPDYKANRDTTHKPHWYKEIQEYLIKYYNAEVIVSSEADDAMAWHQWEDSGTRVNDQFTAESCICTIDKDLNMVPGFHFNWNANKGKGDMFWIEPDTADRVFFEQWLMGDNADNIPGIPKVGTVTAAKLLKDIPDDTEILYDEVMRLWHDRTSQPAKFVHMIGDLLWMERVPGDKWDKHYGLTNKRVANNAAW